MKRIILKRNYSNKVYIRKSKERIKIILVIIIIILILILIKRMDIKIFDSLVK